MTFPSSAATGSERSLSSLVSHRPIDVLPDRRAETAAEWMADNPEIQVVSRDRGTEYASAATQGAHQAIQIADRFHICKNLTEATQLLLARCQAEIAAARKMEEPAQNESGQPMISIEEWRAIRACPREAKTLNSAGRTRGPL
jgi:transposase